MRLSALALLTLLAVPAVTRADVPPPPDYVETCTVQKQVKPGLSCRACRNWRSAGANHCVEEVGEGYVRVCNSLGASAWDEVWCKAFGNPLDAGAIVPAADAGAVACETSGSSDEPASPTEALALQASADAEADSEGAVNGGCSALGGAVPSVPGLLVASWLALRLRRRRAR